MLTLMKTAVAVENSVFFNNFYLDQFQRFYKHLLSYIEIGLLKSRETCESHQCQHGMLKNKRKMNNRSIFLQCIFASLEESSPV